MHPPSVAIWTKGAPFVLRHATLVDSLFPRASWTSTYAGHGEIYPAKPGVTNHGQYAADFMVSSKAEGDRISAYVWAHRAELGVRYVIWWRRIISVTNTPSQWRAYINPVASKRGTASGDHTNHVHVSFFSDDRGAHDTTSPASPGMEDRYMDRITKAATLGQALTLGENALKLNKDGDLSLVTDPFKDVDVTVTLDVRGPDGKPADPRLYVLTFRTVKYDSTPKPKNKPTEIVADEIPVTGTNQARYAGPVGSVADPFSLRLRLVVTALAEGLTVARYTVDGWAA